MAAMVSRFGANRSCTARGRASLLAAIAALSLAGCGTKEPVTITDPAAYLPQSLGQTGITRTSLITRFVGEALYQYIDGGAEIYYQYGFAEVVTAPYQTSNGQELTVDIYRFASPDLAFGLFSAFRPDQPTPVPLGVQGFQASAHLEFVKGPYVVRVTAFADSHEIAAALRAVGNELDKIIPGLTALPAGFALLPDSRRLKGSERLWSESFLGHKFLNRVYEAQYALATDTFMLFVTTDSTAEKHNQWRSAEETHPTDSSAAAIPFEQGTGRMIESDFHGTIVFGRVAFQLVGVVGYRDALAPFISTWLSALARGSGQ